MCPLWVYGSTHSGSLAPEDPYARASRYRNCCNRVDRGRKWAFFSAPTAEAVVPSVAMDVFQMHQNVKNLPEQKMNDMTFVFSESD